MNAFTYKYRGGYNSKVSADVAGPVCQKLHDAQILTPENLVNEARAETSPLHSAFEWNDSVAAEKYRCEQARLMIANIIWVKSDIQTERRLKLIDANKFDNVETEEASSEKEANFSEERAFVSTGEQNHRYVPIAVALTNEEWRRNLLKSAKRDMNSFITKYHRLEELDKIINDMNDFLGA